MIESSMANVLALRGKGISQKYIAEELGCTKQNVSFHVQNAKRKGWLDDKSELTTEGLTQLIDSFKHVPKTVGVEALLRAATALLQEAIGLLQKERNV